MDVYKYLEESLKKYGAGDSYIWWQLYYDSDPQFRGRKYKIDYQSLLVSGISKRVRVVRESFVLKKERITHRNKSTRLIQTDFFPSSSERIGNIEHGKQLPKYPSFITSTIIRNIITIANNKEEYKRSENADSSLPCEIDGVWLIFGTDNEILDFLKNVFYSLFEELFNMYTIENIYGNVEGTEFSPDTKVIHRLLCFNAPFSLIHGLLKINTRENQVYTEDRVKLNKQMRKLLIDTIEYSWRLIQSEVLDLFKKTFKEFNKINQGHYDSKNINKDIMKWNEKEFIPFIKRKTEEISVNDRIANMGIEVDDLMEELLYTRDADKNHNTNIYFDDDLGILFEQRDEAFFECALKLTELQSDYNIKMDKLKYSHKATAEEIECYELCQEDSMDSGKSFEEVIEEAKQI